MASKSITDLLLTKSAHSGKISRELMYFLNTPLDKLTDYDWECLKKLETSPYDCNFNFHWQYECLLLPGEEMCAKDIKRVRAHLDKVVDELDNLGTLCRDYQKLCDTGEFQTAHGHALLKDLLKFIWTVEKPGCEIDKILYTIQYGPAEQ